MRPLSTLVRLSGCYKSTGHTLDPFGIRFQTYPGRQLVHSHKTTHHGSYRSLVGSVLQSRSITQSLGAVQYAVKPSLGDNKRRPPNDNILKSGSIRSEPIPGSTRDALAVQQNQPQDDLIIEPDLSGRVIAFHDHRFSPVFRPELSEEQRFILEKVLQGESVFFTGSAGTGKSVLLRAIIEALGGPSDKVVVTASTGISAVHIGGQTLHSFAGVGLGHGDLNLLAKRIQNDELASRRWRMAKVLIIDEVSMVDATWFDQLEELARKVRARRRPFGGIQLVICGDFFQLPPVPNRDLVDAPASFVFDSWSWDQCVKTKVMLTQVFRQKDKRLVKMLNDARVGVVTDESAELLKRLARPVHYEDGIGPTEIYPRRFEADYANRKQLLALPGKRRAYIAYDSQGKDDDDNRIDPERAARLFAGMIVPRVLPLKVGAQVMCLRNVRTRGLVNGSIGRVVDFMTPGQAKIYAEGNPRWSIITSIKPADTPNPTEASPSDTPVPGRTTRALWSTKLFENTEWPIVQFMDGQCALMGPTNFTVETRNGTIEVKRLQVPLVLAWALTVHKSQGQTLERVKINLQRTFENGQAYVALSRCTSLDTLEVYGFDRERSVQAHPRVQQWARTLITLNSFDSPASNSRPRSISPARSRPRRYSQFDP